VGTHDELGTRVAQAVEDTLANDGFKLVRHPDDAHDAVLRINVSTQLEKSLFKVYVNGRLRTSYQVSATLSVETADRVLDVTKYPKGLHISEATELLQVSGSH
jgi:hypothetical protein